MSLLRNVSYRLVVFSLFTLQSLMLAGLARAELPRTGQISTYDQDGNIVDHRGTGQDGDLQAGAVWPLIRFHNNGDGTITDNLTGLMWLKDGSCLGTMSWHLALEAETKINSGESNCEDFTADYDDWALPDIRQLETLFNGQEPVIGDWLNHQGFFKIQAGG